MPPFPLFPRVSNHPARRAGWGLVAAVLLLAGCTRSAREPALPALPDVADRPATFAAVLRAAHEQSARNPADPAARGRLGRLYLANGYAGEAQTVLTSLASDARVSYYLAHAAELAGDPGAQRHWLEATVRRDPDYVPARIALAEMRLKSGDPAGAAAAYTEARRRAPDRPEPVIGLARLRLQAGETAAAEALLEELTAAHPQASNGLALLAQLRERQGDVAGAAALRRRARERKDPPPADPWLDALLEDCFDVQRLALRLEDLVKSGQAEVAATWLARLESIDPNHPLVAQMRALAARHLGRLDEAVAAYERALEAGGEPVGLYPPLVDTLVAADRLAEAETRARAGRIARPDDPLIAVALAEVRIRQGDSQEARELVDAVLRTNPGHVPANRLRARLHTEAGEPAAAAACLEVVRQAIPDDSAARIGLGRLYLELDAPDRAEPVLEEVLATVPADPEARPLLALAKLRLGNRAATDGRFAEALRLYAAATSLQPDLAEAYANWVQVCLRLKDWSGAETAMLRLAVLRPENAAVFASLGDIQRSAGKPEAARSSWRRAISLLPDASHPLHQALAERLDAPTP